MDIFLADQMHKSQQYLSQIRSIKKISLKKKKASIRSSRQEGKRSQFSSESLNTACGIFAVDVRNKYWIAL